MLLTNNPAIYLALKLMQNVLKNKIKRSSNDFLNKLERLRKPIYDISKINHILSELENSYRQLVNFCQIYNHNMSKTCKEYVLDETFMNLQDSMIIENNNKKDILNKDEKLSNDENPKNKDQNTKTYKYINGTNNFSVIYNETHGILDINTGYSELDCICFDLIKDLSIKDQVDSLKKHLAVYWDISWRKCDFCLQKYNLDFEIPLLRKEEGDFISAFHSKCIDRRF